MTRRTQLLILAATLLVLLLPMLIRHAHGYPLIHSSEAYEHAQAARHIAQGHFTTDPLLSQPLPFNLYEYFLAFFYLSPSNLTPAFIPLLLGIASTLLLYAILQHLHYDPLSSFFATLFLLLSPFFIYSFTTLAHLQLVFFLTLLGLWFYLKDHSYLAVLSWTLILATSWLAYLTLWFLLFLYLPYHHPRRPPFLPLLIAGFCFWLLLTGVLHVPLTQETHYTGLHLRHYVTDLGATLGHAFPTLLLTLFVLPKHWKKKPTLAVLFLFIPALFAPSIRLYLDLILSVTAGLTLVQLARKRWHLSFLRNLTLLLLVCLVLFSTLSYTSRLVTFPPDPNLTQALLSLAARPPGRVLTLPDYTPYVTYYAQKPPFLADPSPLYSSQRLDLTKQLLQQQGVRYIVITGEMRDTLWKNPDDGLLLLLGFSESFIKRSEVGPVQVWEYKGAS